MTTTLKPESVAEVHPSLTEYFRCEEGAQTRHEYLAGILHDMGGASDRHNLIAGNIFVALHHHLHSTAFECFIAEMKVRITLAGQEIFYYPDVVVCGDGTDRARYYRHSPKTIFEVLSPTTERVDRVEKLFAYQTIPALEEYVLLGQDQLTVTLFERQHAWRPAVLTRRTDMLRIPSLQFRLALETIYAKTGL